MVRKDVLKGGILYQKLLLCHIERNLFGIQLCSMIIKLDGSYGLKCYLYISKFLVLGVWEEISISKDGLMSAFLLEALPKV